MKLKTPVLSRNTIIFLSIGCVFFVIYLSRQETDIPFDKNRWLLYLDDKMDGGLRNRMLNNLLETHTLTGLSYHQLTDLLGEPEDNSGRVEYLIKATYDVIDPDYTKYLVIKLNKDSVVDHFIIKEWRKGDE